jgi:hypothetical protein
VRPRVLRRRLAFVAYGAILAGAGIGFAAAPAKADTVEGYAFRNATAICALLANDDSSAGVTEVARRLFVAGVEPYQAGQVMYLAVDNVCPAEMGALLAWAHTVTPSPTFQASERIGGAIA